MRLHKLLFESINKQTVLNGLETIFATNTTTANQLNSKTKASTMEQAEALYDQNKDTFDRILKGATQLTFLGSGTKGTAFDLGGNMVLKIELDTPWDTRFSADKRADKSAGALFGGSSLGAAVPMVYDSGTLNFKGKTITWILLEKFEIPKQVYRDMITYLLDKIKLLITNGEDLLEINNYDDDPDKYYMHMIGTKLNLADDWFLKLIDSILTLLDNDIADLHGGNIGIRRIGSSAQGWMVTPGYLVFFD